MENIKKIILPILASLLIFISGVAATLFFERSTGDYALRERAERSWAESAAGADWTAGEELYSARTEIRSFFNSRAGIMIRGSAEDKSMFGVGAGTRFGSYVITAKHILTDTRLNASIETERLQFFLYEEPFQQSYTAERLYEDPEMDFALLKLVGLVPAADSLVLASEPDEERFNN